MVARGIGAYIVVAVAVQSGRCDPPPVEVVRGAVARFDAVTGLDVEYATVFPDNPGLTAGTRFRFIHAPPSWKHVTFTANVEGPDGKPSGVALEQHVVSHGNNTYRRAFRAKDERVGNLTVIDKPTAWADANVPEPPIHAGSFPYETTRNYVRDRVAEATETKPDEIEGVAARVFEWRVPAPQAYSAFHAVNRVTERGGILRVAVAPQLGFAVVRVDAVGFDGAVGSRTTYSKFVTRNGLSFPQLATRQNFEGGAVVHEHQTVIETVHALNDSIPDDVFVQTVPYGTAVTASLNGRMQTFKLTPDDPANADLPSAVVVHHTPWYRGYGAAVGGGVVVGLSLVGWWSVSRWRNRP